MPARPDMAGMSLIICTRNRAQQLETCLDWIGQADRPPGAEIEIVVVDNKSHDSTQDVYHAFAARTAFQTRLVEAGRVGLGHARNCGIRAAQGELIAFTDDDCHVCANCFTDLIGSFNPQLCQYGAGEVLLANPDDDPKVANLAVPKKRRLPPRVGVLRTGLVQGANMFFHRSVFEKAGLFNEDMGAGTDFPCEDIEMACRASNAGFTGFQLPGFPVYHAHGRKLGSAEALKTIHDYDYGRGAYFASLITRGVPGVWKFWKDFASAPDGTSPKACARLARELQGAANYLTFLAERDARAGAPHEEPLLAPADQTPVDAHASGSGT